MKENELKRYSIGLITRILLTASALPLIAQEDASGLTLEKDGEQVLIPLDEWVVVSSAYDPSNTVRGLYMGMTVDALRIQEKGESFEREIPKSFWEIFQKISFERKIPMDEIGSIFTGKTKSTRDYVFQGMKVAGIGTMLLTMLWEMGEVSGFAWNAGMRERLGYGCIIGVFNSFFTAPAGALIGYMRAKVAEGKAVEYVIGDGEWVIVK